MSGKGKITLSTSPLRPVTVMLCPQSIKGGDNALYTVILSDMPGTAQQVQVFADKDVFVGLPNNLEVPAHQLGRSITLKTKTIGGTDPVYATIYAIFNGILVPCVLTVNP